jgi:hypothetical protein
LWGKSKRIPAGFNQLGFEWQRLEFLTDLTSGRREEWI